MNSTAVKRTAVKSTAVWSWRGGDVQIFCRFQPSAMSLVMAAAVKELLAHLHREISRGPELVVCCFDDWKLQASTVRDTPLLVGRGCVCDTVCDGHRGDCRAGDDGRKGKGRVGPGRRTAHSVHSLRISEGISDVNFISIRSKDRCGLF